MTCARKWKAIRSCPRTISCAGTRSSPRRAGWRPTGRRNGAAPTGTPCRNTSSRRSAVSRLPRPSFLSASACARPSSCVSALPRIYDGTDFWCQGYSEPGSGSDLASLKTRAVRDNGHYMVTGQKIWTTLAHHADWIFCLVRTDPNTGKRQDGISFLLIDMKTPGITVRPITLLDGSQEVNEVFFDEVRVPAENLVHEEGKGWTVAKYLLG